MDATNREVENMKVLFYILEDGAKIPVGHKKTSGTLVFDTRMTHEYISLWVRDRHVTPETKWSDFT